MKKCANIFLWHHFIFSSHLILLLCFLAIGLEWTKIDFTPSTLAKQYFLYNLENGKLITGVTDLKKRWLLQYSMKIWKLYFLNLMWYKTGKTAEQKWKRSFSGQGNLWIPVNKTCTSPLHWVTKRMRTLHALISPLIELSASCHENPEIIRASPCSLFSINTTDTMTLTGRHTVFLYMWYHMYVKSSVLLNLSKAITKWSNIFFSIIDINTNNLLNSATLAFSSFYSKFQTLWTSHKGLVIHIFSSIFISLAFTGINLFD